jgi:hypothetical protein
MGTASVMTRLCSMRFADSPHPTDADRCAERTVRNPSCPSYLRGERQSSPMNFPHFALVSFKSSSLICVVAGNSSIQW